MGAAGLNKPDQRVSTSSAFFTVPAGHPPTARRHILLPMQDDPVRYWQDLTNNYRGMSDRELLELAERPEDLTEVAQQVLRDEMKLRKLEKPRPFTSVPRTITVSRRNYDVAPSPFVDSYADSYIVPSDSEDMDEHESDAYETSHEFTWKTLLCDCQSNDHALQLSAALRRHGIESWVRQISAYTTDLLNPQVYVAADQLEQARAVAAQPIPQDILDEWNTVVPEFELPACPGCGSKEEVVLQETVPLNVWLCEACGAEWTEPESAPDNNPTSP